MSSIRKLSAVLLAVAVLTGIPYLLLWHLPWPELPQSWEVAAAHLRGRRLPPGVATALLIVALWTLWGLYAAGLAVEVRARLRGLPRVLRPLGPLQAVAATAVAAVAANPAAALADTVAAPDTQEEDSRREGEPPPAPEAADPGQPSERVRTVSGFGVGSAELTEQMREDLAPVAEMIADYGDPDSTVRVTGHTDPSGSASANLELSERRAQAVADHLAGLLGEGAPGFEVRGAGSGEPRDGGPESQRRAEVAYTVVPRVQADTEADEAAAPMPGTETRRMAATGSDAAYDPEADPDRQVVVVEIPDGAVTGAVAFAGLAGGYLIGKRGGRLPRISLSLPRLTASPRPRRLALPAPPPRPVPGEEIDERVTVELDHVPGLGITGPGSAGAARRLIVNALDRLDENAVRVLITDADAVRLLGERGRDLLRSHPCAPVTMVGTMEAALAALQRELHRDSDEPRPPLALVTSPSPRHETALSGLLLHGQRQGVTAVVLGRWPLGGSCDIAEDGLITETSPPLNLLFHCSWPAATADEVMRAIRAYRHSSPAAERSVSASRDSAPAGRRPRPLADPERAEAVPEASAFAEALVPVAPEERQEAAAEQGRAEGTPGEYARPSGRPAVPVAEPETEAAGSAWSEPVPVGPPGSEPAPAEVAADAAAGASEAAERPVLPPGRGPRPRPATEETRRASQPEPRREEGAEPRSEPPLKAGKARRAAPRPQVREEEPARPRPGTPAGAARAQRPENRPEPRAEVPGESGPGPWKEPVSGNPPEEGRERRPWPRPRPEPGGQPAEKTARPALTARMERLETVERSLRRNAARNGAARQQAAEVEEGGDTDGAQASRPVPRKPKKAGRGRTWRPREGA
ncbi:MULTISPECIES: OmpA family protein [unclassified Nocardiopsis]|uniref:OmpA family protein n=1 Tax=unclassified Nocardiopsis TaxID=2649073 RepID=UPI001356F503|nr:MULTISPECIES: OmpA family protein [unclassified Nocardiopsis]